MKENLYHLNKKGLAGDFWRTYVRQKSPYRKILKRYENLNIKS